ncbi:MAG: 4-hydroxy-tetrahydrodipicolinate reductase, partial [Chthoniobacteraceae bacterium]
MALRLLINGAKGRMGRMLIACAGEIPELSIGAAVDVG